MNATHAAGSQQTMHNITTHTCEIDGDVAHAESYVMGAILNRDGVTARLLCGRYIDRLERRDGEWRICGAAFHGGGGDDWRRIDPGNSVLQGLPFRQGHA